MLKLIIVSALFIGLVSIATYLLWRERNHQTLRKFIENRLYASEKMSVAEKKSRERVRAILHSTQTPMQKCVALDHELAMMKYQLTIPRYWERNVRAIAKEIMLKNNIKIRRNKRNGKLYIVNFELKEHARCKYAYQSITIK